MAAATEWGDGAVRDAPALTVPDGPWPAGGRKCGMTTVASRVKSMPVEAVIYPFSKGSPYIVVPNGRYGHHVNVDPFPAYAHDRDVVCGTLIQVEALFPVRPLPVIALLPFEEVGYTNGHTSHDFDYNVKTLPRPWAATIVLSGKRIPIHPAMTRYLTAHEYGHVVELDIEHARGYEQDRNLVLDEYRKVRPIPPAPAYGGGSWHLQPAEVFANDFRILVAGVEVEFWPHPTLPRPESVPGLREWWAAEVAAAKERAA